MKLFKLGILLLALAGGSALAAPNADITWTEPTNYEDGTVIPPTDVVSYGLYCGTATGGPYVFYGIIGADTTQALAVDLNACVGGVPGTYFFVLTAASGDFNTESVNSNELSVTYSPADLGKVPLPPILISIQ
jgi:hypothetical protein